MPLPARIQDAPDLREGLEFYSKAFNRLTTSRTMGHGAIGAIPYAAISGYCKDEGITGELREDLFYHVAHMDAAYIKWQTNKANRDAAQASKVKPPSKGR